MSSILEMVGLKDIRLSKQDRATVNDWLRMDNAMLRAKTGIDGLLIVSPRGFANETSHTWICDGSLANTVNAAWDDPENFCMGEPCYIGRAKAEELDSKWNNEVNAWAEIIAWDDPEQAKRLRILVLLDTLECFACQI